MATPAAAAIAAARNPSKARSGHGNVERTVTRGALTDRFLIHSLVRMRRISLFRSWQQRDLGQTLAFRPAERDVHRLHERLIAIEALIQLLKILLGRRLESHVQRRMYPANHRHQVGDESQLDRAAGRSPKL